MTLFVSLCEGYYVSRLHASWYIILKIDKLIVLNRNKVY